MIMNDDSNDFYSENVYMFINNTETEGSGGIVYGVNRETTALILESTLIDNTAGTCGIENLLTIAESHHNNLTVVTSVFENNRATDNSTELGGGIACVKGGSISVTCSAFNENTAASHAGVFYVMMQLSPLSLAPSVATMLERMVE